MKSSIKRNVRRKLQEYRGSKWERPFSQSHPLHITLKSTIKSGDRSLGARPMRTWLEKYIPELAGRFRVKLYHWAINSDHLHLVVLVSEKIKLANFLRALCGNTARKALGAERGRAQGIKYWAKRPYSRVLSWGRELRNVIHYVERNILESRGRIGYIARDQNVVPAIRAFIEEEVAMRFENHRGSYRQLALRL